MIDSRLPIGHKVTAQIPDGIVREGVYDGPRPSAVYPFWVRLSPTHRDYYAASELNAIPHD